MFLTVIFLIQFNNNDKNVFYSNKNNNKVYIVIHLIDSLEL